MCEWDVITCHCAFLFVGVKVYGRAFVPASGTDLNDGFDGDPEQHHDRERGREQQSRVVFKHIIPLPF